MKTTIRRGTKKNDRIIGNNNPGRLFGLAGNDVLQGLGGNDFLSGGTGNDILDGGKGNDSIRGDAGNDILNGGAGNDRLQGDAGDDTLNGDAGDDILNGGTGNDTLFGGEGVDTLNGGDGNDRLTGSGNDKLVGGLGDDLYFVKPGDSIVENANGGIDTLNVLDGANGSLVNFAHVENLTLTNNTAATGTGNDLNNVITGNFGANVLEGGAGDDRLLASGVPQSLGQADQASDTLLGGAGNDTLVAGAGGDVLTGGAGDDLFEGGGVGTVYNLDQGRDTVRTRGFIFGGPFGTIGPTVNQFTRGTGGDLLLIENFLGQAPAPIQLDVVEVNGNTEFRNGDGIAGNAGFGTGNSVLLTLVGVTGFNANNIAQNVAPGNVGVFSFS